MTITIKKEKNEPHPKETIESTDSNLNPLKISFTNKAKQPLSSSMYRTTTTIKNGQMLFQNAYQRKERQEYLQSACVDKQEDQR